MDQVARARPAARSSNVTVPQLAGLEPGVKAAQRELPGRAERRDLEDLRVGAVVADVAQRRLPGHASARCRPPARAFAGRQVHLRLAVVIGAGQFGEGAVQPSWPPARARPMITLPLSRLRPPGLAPGAALRVKCSGSSMSMTWLTDPRSAATWLDLPRDDVR